MDIKEMTKRHIVTCSVIVLLVIISAFTVCGTKAVPTATKSNAKAVVNVKKTVAAVPRILTFIYKPADAESDFTFANAAIPLKDAGVTRKLMLSLKKHSFKRVHSNILQAKAEKMFPIIEPILKAYGIPDD